MVSYLSYADSERCGADDAICRRVHQFQPTLPLAPPFAPAFSNPCLRLDEGTSCIPQVHVIGGWHSFVDRALVPLLQGHQQLALRLGGSKSCFNGWGDAPQAWRSWFGGWRVKPREDKQLVQVCGHMLQFYPDFQNGYLREFLRAYWPCKATEVAKLKAAGKDEGAYYGAAPAPMWATCRPAALAAHDAATGTGGRGHEMTPPFIMKAVYGSRPPTLLVPLQPRQTCDLPCRKSCLFFILAAPCLLLSACSWEVPLPLTHSGSL